jgi:hypothetical protein
MDEKLLFNNFFIPWFLFNWISDEAVESNDFDSTITVAENYVKSYEKNLNDPEKQFIEAMKKTYYSFYSVLDVDFEKSLTVKDIMLGTTHFIKERKGTHCLKRGDVLFSRILTVNNQSIFIGMAPFLIPVQYNTSLIDFRKWLIEENNQNPLNPEVLRGEFDWELLDYFFEIMEAVYTRSLPTLFNTDGDLLQFSKSYFELFMEPKEVLNRLLPLTLSKDAEQFLQDAQHDKRGGIKKVEFPWLRKGNKQHKNWNNTVMGHITLEKGKLILETNSEKRIQKGKKLLSKYLGEAIQFQKTLIESPEQKMKSMSKSDKENIKKEDDLLLLPEVQEQIKAMAQAHWETWFDQPIPVLDNQTPRQAAETVEGREKLEALLLQYERYDLEREDNDPLKANIDFLRTELALNKNRTLPVAPSAKRTDKVR